MPKLKCDAKSCTYNSKEYCCKSVIHVIGSKASSISDTSCGSYHKKKYDTFDTEFATLHENDFSGNESINQYVTIDCDTKNCKYNHNLKCCSEKVIIHNDNKLSMGNNETMCKTFQNDDRK